MEQALGRRHRQEAAHFGPAARFAEDHDRVRVAAEVGDVVAHPLQGLHDVEHADVAGVSEFRPADVAQVRVTEGIEPVIDADHDHVAALGEVSAAVDSRGGRALREAAAVQPHHHRPLAAVVDAGRIHVQHQAVFAVRHIGRNHKDGEGFARRVDRRRHHGRRGLGIALRRQGTKREGIAHTSPLLRAARRHEAIRTFGGCSVGNAEKDVDALGSLAAELARRSLRDHIRAGRAGRPACGQQERRPRRQQRCLPQEAAAAEPRA